MTTSNAVGLIAMMQYPMHEIRKPWKKFVSLYVEEDGAHPFGAHRVFRSKDKPQASHGGSIFKPLWNFLQDYKRSTSDARR